MNSMKIVVDVELFAENVVKEMAFCNPFYCVGASFKPPHEESWCSTSTRNQNRWLTSNLHKIQWDSGKHDYCEMFQFVRYIKVDDATYYAKGLEKCELLANLFRVEFVNLEDMGCPTVNQLQFGNGGGGVQIACDSYPQIHIGNAEHCAQQKARLFADWMQMQQQ